MGIKAVGEYELSLDLIDPNVDFPDAFSLSYALEDGLQKFYLALEKEEQKAEFQALYKKLAGFEDLHKDRLLQEYGSIIGGDLDPQAFLKVNPDVVEGGDLVKNTPISIAAKMTDLRDILGLSMAIEAQSLDLYTRLAEKSDDEAVTKLFLGLADEEKQHMVFITREMEKYLKN